MIVNPIIENLLMQRGIEEDQMEEFLSLKPQLTYDPFLLEGLEEGVDMVLAAIKAGKRICIYGDYDADGITSVSVMLTVLGRLTNNIFYYIPSRFTEGYGLNCQAIDKCIEQGAELILTVDCGSVSFKEVEYVKSKGIDIIVTDHHNMDDRRVDCLLINPKNPDSNYPFRFLAGCGVAFKFAQGIQKKAELPKAVLSEVLDLVAIGTIGDIMPLVDENRTLVKYGIAELRKGKRPGLCALCQAAGIDIATITSENIAFIISPHLNAAGRIKDADVGVDLMMSDGHDAEAIAAELVQRNNTRKKLQTEAYDKCIDILEKNGAGRFIVIKCDDAHEGITGIVAGKIKEFYGRPVIIVSNRGEFFKGTGRSITGVDIFEIIAEHAELLEQFGGHSGACGFTIREENIKAFDEAVNRSMDRLIAENPYLLDAEPDFDMEIESEDLTLELAEGLELLGPFGSGNEKPVFAVSSDDFFGINRMGDKQQHIRFAMHTFGQKYINCVAFNKGEELESILKSKENLTLLGNLSLRYWKGNPQIQFMVQYVTEF